MTETVDASPPIEAKTPEVEMRDLVIRMRTTKGVWSDFVRSDLKPETFEKDPNDRIFILGMINGKLDLRLTKKESGKVTDEEAIQKEKEKLEEIFEGKYRVARTGILSLNDPLYERGGNQYVGETVLSNDITGSAGAMMELIEANAEAQAREKLR